ncbi:MAG: peptide deformylase [Bacteriovoracaceae bacterium]
MIRPICRMGNPILREKARPISQAFLNSNEFTQLLEDLKDSMKHYGGIGIAAPQIGVSLQVAIIQLEGLNRYQEEIHLPLTIFVNPEIEVLDPTGQSFWEGCLSVPGLRGNVERPKKVKVKYLDQRGEDQEIVAEGFLATVLQHELDHLFGILYIDRIKDMTLLSYQEEYESFILKSNL